MKHRRGKSARLLPALAALMLLGCASTGPSTLRQAQGSGQAPGRLADDAEACLPGGPEVCLNAWDDNCNGVADEGCGLRTGLAQFLVAWDASGADVDLHVVDPSGQLAQEGQATRLGLLKDKDCPGQQQECHGARIENVYLEAGRTLPKGAYTVQVRLQKMPDKDTPVRVTLAVRLGSQSHAQRMVLQHEGDQRRFRFVW